MNEMQRPAWRVLKTRVKCEKVVRDQLLALGLEAYVPVIRRTARYVRKIKVYELPLITCYTFVRLPKDRRIDALALPYVQGILRVDGQDCIVTDREMEWLERVSGSGMDVHVETVSLRPGEKILLAHGQLAGLEGRVLHRHGKQEVTVQIESLGLQLVMHVREDMLVRAS